MEFLIVHCCAFDAESAVLSFKQNDVSAHYIIGQNGDILPLVAEENCAWHAGKSHWHGRDLLNKTSIGIELCSPSLGQNAYPPSQIKSLICLLKKLQKKYGILPQNILGHSDIAPQRKPDPGKAFPWKELAQNGLGLWYKTKDADKAAADDVAELLKTIGYDTSDINAALCAFCRRFYPSKICRIKDMAELLNNPGGQIILPDKRLIRRLKAVAYAYLSASKKPCRI